MKLIISHKKTKREINGAFAICGSTDDLLRLKNAIDEKLQNKSGYGWINIDEIFNSDDSEFLLIKRQKELVNTSPSEWD